MLAIVLDFVASVKPNFSSLALACFLSRSCPVSMEILSLSSSCFWDNNNFKFCSVNDCVAAPICSSELFLEVSSIDKFVISCNAFPSVFICVTVPTIALPKVAMP